jgi:hypothetical protein
MTVHEPYLSRAACREFPVLQLDIMMRCSMMNVVLSDERIGVVALRATFYVLSLELSNWRRREEHLYVVYIEGCRSIFSRLNQARF